MKIRIDTIIDNLPKREHDIKKLNSLTKDIKENGLINPITLNKNRELLAGRRRLKSLKKLGYHFLEENKDFKIINTKDALHDFDIFLMENLERQDLSDLELGRFLLERKKIYEKLHPETKHGGDRKSKEIKRHSVPLDPFVADTSKQINTAERTIREKIQAYEIVEKRPELAKHIKAKKIIRENKLEEQKKAIKKLVSEKKIKGTYDIIVIDPPWKYNAKYDPDGRRGSGAYPEMSLEELQKEKIPFGKNCVVWLWCTNKFIEEAHRLLKGWGFEFKTILTWDKEIMGLGTWLRNRTEHCLLGIKGKPYFNNTKWTTLISEKRTTHSTKPEVFYKMVEEICAGRKLDYFARKKREGWDVWGDEVK